ncbi:MAG TPA: polysaccharide deacetylase family protein [Rhizomicrobium sp.]|nr:polysaccharide deacetylase family protein [Rhizomicrobium sp.]
MASRLGFDPATRLLIVHADDLGIAQSVNVAFAAGLATGLINSGSVMVPCRWFSGVVDIAKAHPAADIGLHLTLTSDGPSRKWRPISAPAQVLSLVDEQGYFFDRWPADTRISAREVEIELRAQIEKAYTAGLRPTHLDAHQYCLLSGKEVFEVYLRLGHEYGLPVLVAHKWFSKLSFLEPLLTRRDVILDNVIIMNGKVRPEQWPAFYRRTLEKLRPGVSEILIHPGYDDSELRAFFGDQQDWGATWRQRDFDFFTGDEFRDLLAKLNIRLITWREIAARMQHATRLGKLWHAMHSW